MPDETATVESTTATENGAGAAQEPADSFRAAYDAAQAELANRDGARTGRLDGQTSGDPAAAASEQQTATEEPPLKAPERWTKERQELFGKQPREIQQAMLDMGRDWETGYQKKFEDLAGQRKIAEGVQALFTPELRAQAQAAGYDEVQAIGRLLEMQRLYNADPAGYIGGLLRHSRIDPRIFLSDPAQITEDDELRRSIEPHLKPLREEVQFLRQQNASVQQERQAREARATQTAIADFAGAKDEAGVPVYPHLDRVVDDMAAIIQGDPRIAAMGSHAEKLKAAYDMAVFGNAELRAEMIMAEVSKRAAAVEAERAAATLRKAATSKPAAAASNSQKAPQSLREAYEATRGELGM